MLLLRTYSLFLLSMVAGMALHGEGAHLFILSGQSNMAGLKPEQTFTPAVEEAFGAGNVIVVKDAQGGQPIRQWFKGWKSPEGEPWPQAGKLYDRLMAKVRPAIDGREIETVTFVWMQGERDAREAWGPVYAESFEGLVGQLRQDLGRDDIGVVIGRISDFDMANAKYPHWTMVRDIQEKLAADHERWVWVDTDPYNGPTNDLHHTPEGYDALGLAFAEAAIGLVRDTSGPSQGD